MSRAKKKINISDFNARVHIDHPLALSIFQKNLNLFIAQLYDKNTPFVVLCVGTDRSIGDSLGPFVGTKLKNLGVKNIHIYGTLDEPVHAENLEEIIEEIKSKFDNPFILAVDACLGKPESVGYLDIKEGSFNPGSGVNKSLPSVGNMYIIGIVNVGGFMEYMILQNTRLNLVVKMADIIANGIKNAVLKEKLVSNF